MVATMGTNGTAGDMLAHVTGSLIPLKSQGTGATSDYSNLFVGILFDTTANGSQGVCLMEGVFNLPKTTATDKIEAGNILYANGAALTNKVGTAAAGTAVGVCVKQSGSDNPNVSCKIAIADLMAARGFVA
jgi:predicted RecA/RadA family phage recombinase